MQALLLDMDGVLYNAAQPLPGAADALAWVRHRNIPHLFLSNTSSRDRAALVAKLATFGIPATEDQILTPAVAAAAFLRRSAAGPAALFLRPAARPEFAGIPTLGDTAEQGAAHVVIGDLGDQWDYRTLNRAFRLLHHNPQAHLIALGMTRYWMAPDGISLDVAPFVAALAHATGREPIVFGKPAAPFFHEAAAGLALPPNQILMIGDDIESDVRGAQTAGLRAALVKTGKYRPADLDRGIRPDAVWDSIADLPARWPLSEP
ncbi:MAG: TIGR01458 family HAD-type hydrolase [Bryobacteraceae bacterium]